MLNIWIDLPLLLLFLGIIFYVLHSQGAFVSKCISALVFVMIPGNGRDQARVAACTGWVRYPGRFRESRVYHFNLSAQLTEGDLEVFLLDRRNQPLLRLNRWHPKESVALDGGSRYYVRWEFNCATGQCELYW